MKRFFVAIMLFITLAVCIAGCSENDTTPGMLDTMHHDIRAYWDLIAPITND